MGLHSLGAREVFAIDDMQNTDGIEQWGIRDRSIDAPLDRFSGVHDHGSERLGPSGRLVAGGAGFHDDDGVGDRG